MNAPTHFRITVTRTEAPRPHQLSHRIPTWVKEARRPGQKASHLYASKHGVKTVVEAIRKHGEGSWDVSVEGFVLTSTGPVEFEAAS